MNSDAMVVPVVAACITKGEFAWSRVVLLSKRLTAREPSTLGKWELPGGVVHFGEKLEDAVKREILEELSLHVVPRRVVHAQINTYESGVDYLVVFFGCTLVGGVVHLSNHLRWVSPQSVIEGEWDVLPGTKETVERLLAGKVLG